MICSISRHGGTLGWFWNLRSGADNGRPAYPAVPDSPSPRLSARPDPARRAGATTRLGTGAPSSQSRPPSLGRCSLHGTPRRGLCLALGPRVHQGTILPHDSDRPPPGEPGFQSDAAAARRHGSRSREAKVSGMRGYPRGQLHHTDDPARTPPLPELPDRRPRLIDTGWRLPPFVGCFRLTPRG
jgi:hypothetical protein